MYTFSEVMCMLDWDAPSDIQDRGRNLAKHNLCIKDLLQPVTLEFNKNVWDNCALILSEKSDEELAPYLIELLEWLKDLNWPGAMCILKRLNEYIASSTFSLAYRACIDQAKLLDDKVWEYNLGMILPKA